MQPDEFDRLVAEAYARIPARFRRRMKNVAVLVDDEPSAAQLARGRVASRRHPARTLRRPSADHPQRLRALRHARPHHHLPGPARAAWRGPTKSWRKWSRTPSGTKSPTISAWTKAACGPPNESAGPVLDLPLVIIPMNLEDA